MAIYFASTFAVVRHKRHLCEDNSSPTAHAQIMGYIGGFMTGTVDDNKGIK